MSPLYTTRIALKMHPYITLDSKLSLHTSELKSLLRSRHLQFRILADLTFCQPMTAFIGAMESVLGFPSAKLSSRFGGRVVAEGCVCCMLPILHHSSRFLFSSSQHTHTL